MEQALTEITFSFIYNRARKLDKQGRALIQIRAYQNGRNKYFSTNVRVKPGQWNMRRQEIWKHPTALVFNKSINDQIMGLKRFQYDLINQKGGCTLDDLNAFVNQNRFPSFTDFCYNEIELSTNGSGTKQTKLNTLSVLKEFRKVVYFRDLTYDFIANFDLYLRRDCGLKATTREKYHKHIRTFANLAIKKDFLGIDKNPYRKFSPEKGKPERRTVLTLGELKKLTTLQFDIEDEDLQIYRDVFLFMCFTALRISDACNLRKENILETERGLALESVSIKTGKQISLTLYNLFKLKENDLAEPEKIARKYLELHERTYNNLPRYSKERLFFKTSEKTFNLKLKLIADRAGINKNLTAHVGRHTFATLLVAKLPLPVVQKLMQHESVKTTMIYVQISKHLIEQELDNVKW